MEKTKKDRLDAKRGDIPDKIVRITKDYMRDYIQYQANTEENKAWYLALCKANTVDKLDKNGKPYKDINVSVVRKSFVEKFFSDLLKKDDEETYLDELEKLFG
mgnify:CR=1 FL=1